MCGIPQVTFISDACRSISNSLGVLTVPQAGGYIFPVPKLFPNSTGDVDQFLATCVGAASLEVAVGTSAKEYEGIYTSAFLSAYSQPDANMTRMVDGVNVVPNRRLKNYLSREVAKRAQAKAILRPQVPDTRVVSSDDAYIARVTAQTPPGQNGPAATVHDVAIMELERAGLTGISAALPPPGGGAGGAGRGGRGGGRGGGGADF